MRTDQKSTMKVVPLIDPAAAITGNGVTVSKTIDTLGFESLTLALHAGVETDGTSTVAVFGGNASNMSDERQLTGNELIGSAPVILATEDSTVETVGVNLQAIGGGMRYIRVKSTQSGATSGGFVSGVAILGNARYSQAYT